MQLRLSVEAYTLGNILRRPALPRNVQHWFLTTPSRDRRTLGDDHARLVTVKIDDELHGSFRHPGSIPHNLIRRSGARR